MKKVILFIAVSIIAPAMQAQLNCACCTENHQQFDFWVGDWIVHDTAGNELGENLIIKVEKGCIINEHWKGSKGGSGRSYNYFDTGDSTWNQVWIDSKGSNLVLKGKAEPNKMVLSSKLLPGKKIEWYSNRVTWTVNDDGTVTQLWEILDKEGKLFNIAFLGIYSRKEEKNDAQKGR